MTRHLTSIWFALLPATLLCFAATSTLAQQPPPVSELVAKHQPTNQVFNATWLKPTDPTVTGEKFYWGTTSNYTAVVDVGAVTNYLLKYSLGISRIFYAVTGYNAFRVQGVFSAATFSAYATAVAFTNRTYPTNTVQSSSDLMKWTTAGWQQSLCQTNPTGALAFRLYNANVVAQVKGAQLLRQPLVVAPPTLPNISVNSYTIKLP